MKYSTDSSPLPHGTAIAKAVNMHQPPNQHHTRVAILGSGPAGYTAALYAARAALRPLLIEGDTPGGQLTATGEVENWPGERAGLQGPELMSRMQHHVERFDADVVQDHVVFADLSSRPFRLQARTGSQYTCDTLIIATGATALHLGLPSEQEFMGRGVSGCAVCDGLFYRDQDVVVVGGGNTAVEEALLLSKIARHVSVVHRRARFRAEGILVQRLQECVDAGVVDVVWEHEVAEVLGDHSGVTGVRLRHTLTGRMHEIESQGLFVAIGHRPNTAMFEGQLEMNGGYIVTRGTGRTLATETSVPGVFAAGDVQDSTYRQAITSAASGCMAALDADRFLSEREF